MELNGGAQAYFLNVFLADNCSRNLQKTVSDFYSDDVLLITTGVLLIGIHELCPGISSVYTLSDEGGGSGVGTYIVAVLHILTSAFIP